MIYKGQILVSEFNPLRSSELQVDVYKTRRDAVLDMMSNGSLGGHGAQYGSDAHLQALRDILGIAQAIVSDIEASAKREPEESP